jgi:hypothetical protein
MLMTWHVLKLEEEPVGGEEVAVAKESGYQPSTNCRYRQPDTNKSNTMTAKASVVVADSRADKEGEYY